jgi:hypothetical protein
MSIKEIVIEKLTNFSTWKRFRRLNCFLNKMPAMACWDLVNMLQIFSGWENGRKMASFLCDICSLFYLLFIYDQLIIFTFCYGCY